MVFLLNKQTENQDKKREGEKMSLEEFKRECETKTIEELKSIQEKFYNNINKFNQMLSLS